MPEQPLITLTDDVAIPQLGFGTFKVDNAETQRVVEAALEAGYRHIDTAEGYYNEEGVGAGLRASGLDRAEVFLTTKVRNRSQGYESTLAAFDASRRALGVDVVDLYLIHWPLPSKGLVLQTWRALEKLHAEGKVRAIGVCNHLPHHLADLLAAAEVTPVVNQVEIHPTFQQRAVQDASRQAGLAIEAYAPIGKGEDLSDPVVVRIAEDLGRDPGQVVIRWHLQAGRIVIPKSATPSRIASNARVFDFELTPQQMAALDGLDRGNRLFPDPDEFDGMQDQGVFWSPPTQD